MNARQRKRLQRARQRGEAPPPATCSSCSTRITGAHGALCTRCWLRTDAGRAWQRERVAEFRRRKKA